MTFGDILDGTQVFLDANTLIYHFTRHPVCGTASSDLLHRIDAGHVEAFTAAHLMSETAHRVMTIEASQLFGWPFAGIARNLRRHWQQIQNLPTFRQAVDEVRNSRIHVYPVDIDQVVSATVVSKQFGLLSNDALTVAVMRHHGLTNLASNDADFDRAGVDHAVCAGVGIGALW